ncbi:MAG: VOC family protein [Cyanobacteria bacterium J06638_22]
MNVWSGVITKNLEASKAFYIRLFGCAVIYESDWFVLLKLGNRELGFMLPNLETQASIFQSGFEGKGIWITLDVDDVDAEYDRIKAMNVPIEVELRDEPWGDRHFAFVDPNGIGIDIVQKRSIEA